MKGFSTIMDYSTALRWIIKVGRKVQVIKVSSMVKVNKLSNTDTPSLWEPRNEPSLLIPPTGLLPHYYNNYFGTIAANRTHSQNWAMLYALFPSISW